MSLFAFGFLVPRCRPDGALHDPTQIGIEVAVPQLAGPNRKAAGCKDLVIWPQAAGTCWERTGTAARLPLAILEWKARTGAPSSDDEEWLRAFSGASPGFVGFAVSIRPGGAATTLMATRVRNGLLTKGWLSLPVAGIQL